MAWAGSIVGGARRGAAMVLAFALPPRCPGCGGIQAEDHHFCADCWRALDFAGADACHRCGATQEIAPAGGECGACLADPPPWDRMAAAVSYGPIARAIALRLKHGGRTGLAETVARQMARRVEIGPDTLIAPVPLHRWRIWRRGYNQSALIARRLAAARGGTLALDLLRRDKATPMLRGLGRKARAETVRGAFSLSSDWGARVKGGTVLLVDDVLTTGATATACAKALKRAGVASVSVVTWARVQRDVGQDVDFHS
ncbi:ComF family protein [Sphingomonas naphthae]|uniref:ComF family protein n=1 Tax=Sphingomonas naphthae TaxID=1813468 RepID=A0ABY7TFX0_9SPHN|nr:ComF family protein [Sphingomonas naphthae]WCT72127.1 ComF family protein [Sphingomonas naphthae]